MKCRWLLLAAAMPVAGLHAQDSGAVKLRLTLEEGAHVGHRAPQIVLPYATADSAGPVDQPFDLAKELGHAVVLVFYGSDGAPHAAADWQAFAGHENAHRSADLVFAGIARDPVAHHVAFARAIQLPFKLLTDATQLTARRYGMTRVSFGVIVVGRDGRVRYVDARFAPTDSASYVPLDAAITAARERR